MFFYHKWFEIGFKYLTTFALQLSSVTQLFAGHFGNSRPKNYFESLKQGFQNQTHACNAHAKKITPNSDDSTISDAAN